MVNEKKSRGMSLAEILVAMAILVGITLLVMSVIATATRRYNRWQEVSKVNHFLQDTVDQVWISPFTELTSSSGTCGDPDFSYQLSIQPGAISEAKKVKVTVSSSNGVSRSLTLLRAEPSITEGELLFRKYDCAICHDGVVPLTEIDFKSLWENERRSAYQALPGRSTATIEQYVENSIRDPQEYVSPVYEGFNGTGYEMPHQYNEHISPAEMRQLVRYITQ